MPEKTTTKPLPAGQERSTSPFWRVTATFLLPVQEGEDASAAIDDVLEKIDEISDVADLELVCGTARRRWSGPLWNRSGHRAEPVEEVPPPDVEEEDETDA